MYEKLRVLESTIKDYQNPLDSPITLAELLDQIQTLKTQKACGVDGILNEMINIQSTNSISHPQAFQYHP